ncbi:hypothetical protein OPT61_g1310 [Boeremia exigua]|uniref:Uncharacterized protein n=1 Tax=Boeremia exigua TaxID=749465 RepID=A0ACC2IQV4_9PLEO|nr:hypothetical protein OPT61_g1310 [Boeremia exigua]
MDSRQLDGSLRIHAWAYHEGKEFTSVAGGLHLASGPLGRATLGTSTRLQHAQAIKSALAPPHSNFTSLPSSNFVDGSVGDAIVVLPTLTIELHFNMMSKAVSMYGAPGHWSSTSHERQTYLPSPDYTGFPVADMPQSGIPFTLQSDFGSSVPENHHFVNRPDAELLFNEYKTQPNFSAPLEMTSTEMYPSPAIFAVGNAPMDPHDSATVSPTNTRFDMDYTSPGSDTKPLFNSRMGHVAPSNSKTCSDNIDPPSSKRRCDSLHTNFELNSTTMPQAQMGRRRGSEYAEPGSARAVYLEKNRKAASKCRGKQKRQQEELVETARDMERRNRVLKAEVELLRSDVRDLMELVGQHSNCPDARLNLYIQREADRLANGAQHSSLSPRSTSGPPSTDKSSLSEEG